METYAIGCAQDETPLLPVWLNDINMATKPGKIPILSIPPINRDTLLWSVFLSVFILLDIYLSSCVEKYIRAL
ncbi:hypothetical protein [Aeromonas caviae]|uniref:hypothetical protein n=1 Tax=Aeromonas caviae TaxID=648 RepID=UPI002B48117E|nr:hypothetical protein [Aeromonas caviae]